MIFEITDVNAVQKDIGRYMDFSASFFDDEGYSDLFLNSPAELEDKLKGINQADDKLFVCMDGDDIIGWYIFCFNKEERYGEMITCFSRDSRAYAQLLEYLSNSYSGYELYFVFNSSNKLLMDLLKEHQAYFYEEQMRMIASKPSSVKPCDDVVPLSQEYMGSYISLHNKDCYWTGERIGEALDRFDVYVAVKDERVVGYIDLAKDEQVSKVFDIVVAAEHRRLGYGRKLMQTAMSNSISRQIDLEVDVVNTAAIRLYCSLGFERYKPNMITARMIMGGN